MSIVVYGATGYTGRLIIEECLRRGLRPVVAGRDADAVRQLAEGARLPWRIAALDQPRALDALLEGATVLLHSAGPFSATSRPMLDACLRARVPYLDITGEIEVFEACARRDAEARTAGIMVLPGAGFDVVPSDCLAAHLKRRMPDAVRLTLAFVGGSGVSRGTARTMAQNVGRGGAVRRDGRIRPVPVGYRTRDIDFGDRIRHTVTIPWGDVSTAWHSTGIPDIEVYTGASPKAVRSLRLSRLVGPLLRTAPGQALLGALIDRRPPGPSEQARARANARLWGEVVDASGRRMVSRLITPDGYTLTAATAVEIAARTAAGQGTPGFQTPSRAFGADFILDIPGTSREDLP